LNNIDLFVLHKALILKIVYLIHQFDRKIIFYVGRYNKNHVFMSKYQMKK